MISYSRPKRLHLIKEQLNKQTLKDFEFLVWDNTKKNDGSKARFWLVKKAKGEAIIFIDDDESIGPEFVEYMWKAYKKYPKHLLGRFTRTFINGTYWKAKSTCKDEEGKDVDYVGTGGCVVSKNIFNDNNELYNIPKKFDKVEDLYLSYIAKKEGYGLKSILPPIEIIIDGKDQFTNLIEYKEDALEELIKLGFKISVDIIN